MTSEQATARPSNHVRILIIGGGFSGLGMAHRLLQAGLDDLLILERADQVGGVWQANTYPGCTCDVPSHLYSFSFAPNPDWSSTYSPQPEIQAYLKACVDRFGLRSRLRLNVEFHSASWHDADQVWQVQTSQGRYTAQVLISAMGPLTEPKLPDVPGLESFAGTVMHSARWDHDYDLTGKRVASIGTGASAIQYVPKIADDVERLYVFQRSAPWVMPHGKRPIRDAERRLYRRLPVAQKAVRAAVYTARELLVLGFVKRPGLMNSIAGLSASHRNKQITDPQLRRKVTPDYTLGCKRLLPSNTWYPALAKPNVELVSSALAEIRPHSVVGADGIECEVDTIIFGTGYHVTDIPIADHVQGRGGQTLAQAWQGSPRAFFGTSIPGFPNFFMLLGPNTGLGHGSMIYMIEAQIEHIRRAIAAMTAAGAGTLEVEQPAHDAFNAELDGRMVGTVWDVGGCTSFYLDATGRNATIWPDWTWRFRRRAARLSPAAYRFAKPSAPTEAGAR